MKEPMITLKEVESSLRCDMCSSTSLMINTEKDSILYLCKVHKEQLEEAMEKTGE